MSGGFEGVDRQATLTSTGELIAADRKRRIDVTVQTPADEIARISSLVSQLHSTETPRGPVCHDCLLYDLDIRAGDRILTAHVNEAELAGNGVLQKLVDALTSVIRAALGG